MDSPSAVRGVDKLIPVDVYLPGCPPRPEAIMDAIVKLRKKIADQSMQERSLTQQTHRYYSCTHQIRVGSPIHTGQYLKHPERQAPPQEIAATAELPLPATLLSIANLQD
jgi:NAD(P)H-quinone oxidoreductase subunit K